MQIVMARAGRKRNTRMHLSNPAPRIDYRALCGEQPHRRGLPPDKRLSEKAETPFGCLNLMGVISDEQHEAGQRYKVVVQEYRSSIGAPRGEFPMGKGYPCKGELRCGMEEGSLPCECRRRKNNYNEAFEALAEAGHRCQVEVAHVAVHGRPSGNVKALLRGLDMLVRHFGVGRRK